MTPREPSLAEEVVRTRGSDRSGQQEGLRAKAISWNPNKEFMVM